jgi:hypothetical protein
MRHVHGYSLSSSSSSLPGHFPDADHRATMDAPYLVLVLALEVARLVQTQESKVFHRPFFYSIAKV